MAAQLEAAPFSALDDGVGGRGEDGDLDLLQQTRTLIAALNLVSRNLPLPPDVYDAVSSIYHHRQGDPRAEENLADSSGDLLVENFENALVKQQQSHISGVTLRNWKESRLQSSIKHRLTELEGLPSKLGEDLQMKCLLELYGLKLSELQRKVRLEVGSEYWLQEICAYPDKQLFDWGMMRLRYPSIPYGVGDAHTMEFDDRQRKKRDIERLSRLEEEEKNSIETKKRKFFADILNAARELQLQGQAVLKRRKQRNDGVQAWHGRQRQRATRAEKLRFQALKADDQEAYMRMVEESKNERLTMLLGKTNELLGRLGAAVQKQKDSEHVDSIEALRNTEPDTPSEMSPPKSEVDGDLSLDDDADDINTDPSSQVKSNDLLEGQRAV